jgi:hypothetical protein
MRALRVCVVVVLLAPVAADAQIRVRPGQYEYSMEMDLGKPGGQEALDAVLNAAGAKSDAGARKMLQCVTADDVKDMQNPNSIVKLFAREIEEDGTCKVSDIKTAGNKLTYNVACVEDGSRMTMTTEMTFSGDTMTGVTKGNMDGRPMSSTFTAKRIGECPK